MIRTDLAVVNILVYCCRLLTEQALLNLQAIDGFLMAERNVRVSVSCQSACNINQSSNFGKKNFLLKLSESDKFEQ